jgi:hypothetical protein
LLGGSFFFFNGLLRGNLVRLLTDDVTPYPCSLGTRWKAGIFELGLFGETGQTYTIETSANLPQFHPWTNIVSTGTNWLADPQSPAPPQRFFRARSKD